MEFHELANLYPLMQEHEFNELCESIRQSGLRNPITLLDNKILDGRNRFNACLAVKINPIYKQYEGDTSPRELFRYVQDENEQRRHLTDSQRAAISVCADELVIRLENEAKERQVLHGNQYVSIDKTNSAVVAKLPQVSNALKTREILAETFGISARYVQEAKKIKRERPDLIEKIKNGDISIQEAKREIKQDEKEKSLLKLDKLVDTKTNHIKDLQNGWHKIGKHYLYFGSNLDKEFIDFLPQCSFIFADPPYNAGLREWDKNFKWEQDLFLNKTKTMAVTPGGWNAFNFYKETNMNYLWEMACWINNGMTHGRCGFANFIKVSIFGDDKVKIPQDFFQISIKISQTADTYHKGRKPYQFMMELIKMFSNEGDIIADIFAGSGTTLLIADKFNRISYNAEIDKASCIDIINRCIDNGIEYDRL